jgi:predicted ArsR family transcriptional regulator
MLAELAGAEAGERVALVTRLLSEQGYMAEWAAASSEAGHTFRLAEHNCAIRAVAERFPEVCAAEQRFLEDVLGAAVERQAHIPAGCNACEYVITFGTERGESR